MSRNNGVLIFLGINLLVDAVMMLAAWFTNSPILVYIWLVGVILQLWFLWLIVRLR